MQDSLCYLVGDGLVEVGWYQEDSLRVHKHGQLQEQELASMDSSVCQVESEEIEDCYSEAELDLECEVEEAVEHVAVVELQLTMMDRSVPLALVPCNDLRE